jgi:adenosylcobinamide kinase/adenosylcobinamide-phosphate guanylyltransferase
MSVTLVLGGARSGKSQYAERLLSAHPAVTYVAPGEMPDGSDTEWAERISQHRERRPASWTTLETSDLAAVIGATDHPVLIDCLSTWLTQLIDDINAWEDPARAAAHLEKQTVGLLEALGSASYDVVIVTGEVGLSVVPGTASGRMFRDELGKLNAAVSAVSDQVFLAVAGRVLDLSDAPVVRP